jgi:ABC-type bacteriocin/lantibiotic exporter with double-glycine peptidase domain
MTPIILSVTHIRQARDGDCVPVCTLMALIYMGAAVNFDQLVRLLDTRWFGTTSYKIRELEKLGMTVVYKRGDLQELHEHLLNNRPCIAFVNTGELPYWDRAIDHAVVVVGLDDEHVYSNDPDLPFGPIAIPHGDFDLAWLERDEYYATFARRE